ncbi:FAD-linked oxidoreductase [Lichtheimia hyalospora FSU 10163]|nr:FAD-linked oxidoreductase [Lichtheimia hyalospora FSU 10163]
MHRFVLLASSHRPTTTTTTFRPILVRPSGLSCTRRLFIPHATISPSAALFSTRSTAHTGGRFYRKSLIPTAVAAGVATATAIGWGCSQLMDPCYAEAERTHTYNLSAYAPSTASGTVAELLDDEGRVALQAKSTEEILLGLLVYRMCMVPGVVDLAPHVISACESLHLHGPLYWLVKRTVFRQFCGGETPDECSASMERLAQSGINCILDLSIEADLHIKKPKKKNTLSYEEQRADVVVDMIKDCLRTASTCEGSFAAVKVTAFAPPEVLLRLNQAIIRLDQAYEACKRLEDGRMDQVGLSRIVQHVLPPPRDKEQQERREEILEAIGDDALERWQVDKLFDLQGPMRDIWWQTGDDQTPDDTPLTADELRAYDRMVSRLNQVCSMAHDRHVGIMIDAEQSYFQEAIDHVAMNLQAKYNRRDDREHTPTVYNTSNLDNTLDQMYTKNAQAKLERDVARAQRENFGFAAKLVRGAYMVMERKRAAQLGYPSPIHDTIEDTHASFNNGVRFLLDKLRENLKEGETIRSTTSPVVFMVATHNRDSIVLTVQEMERHQVLPRSGVVHFGQLYGMQDQISYTLGKNEYSIYKYLPYGKIDEVMPYLLRRAQENSSLLGGVSKECSLMWQEIKDRASGKSVAVLQQALPPSSPHASAGTTAATPAATAPADTAPAVELATATATTTTTTTATNEVDV